MVDWNLELEVDKLLTRHLGVDAWVAGHDYNLAGMNMAIKTSAPYSSETLDCAVGNGSNKFNY